MAGDVVAAPAGPEDSLRKRYGYKLGMSVAGLPATLVVQALVPRMLGPSAYGNFGFLSAFFLQVIAFCDIGLSSAFYNKLSQRQQDAGLLWFFGRVTAALTALVVMGVVAALALGFGDELWPGQERRFVWMATVWALLLWYGLLINKVTDAFGLTVPSEIVRFLQKLFAVLLALLLYRFVAIELTGFFLFQYATLLFLCLGWWVVVARSGRQLFPRTAVDPSAIRSYAGEFYVYSAPLFVFQVVGLISGVADRWLLQHYAGSVEQGFYALSYQVGALCFLVTGSMTPLFWRELAKAHAGGDPMSLRAIFDTWVPRLFWFAAFLALFVASQADRVSVIVGGGAFRSAALAIAIMACFPIHQTYGQLNAALFMATGQTPLYKNLGITTSIGQLAVTFWLLAPQTLHGLQMGAEGLAIAVVGSQLVGVNLQLWFITRYLSLSYWRYALHQLLTLGGLLILAAGSRWTVDALIGNELCALVAAGFLYVGGAAGVIVLYPSLIRMSAESLRSQVVLLSRSLRGGQL